MNLRFHNLLVCCFRIFKSNSGVLVHAHQLLSLFRRVHVKILGDGVYVVHESLNLIVLRLSLVNDVGNVVGFGGNGECLFVYLNLLLLLLGVFLILQVSLALNGCSSPVCKFDIEFLFILNTPTRVLELLK